MRIARALVAASLLVLAPGVLGAQAEEEEDPFGALVFTPEEIMQHRRAIDLNDEQRDAITRLIQDLQGEMVGLQWRLLDETESVKEAMEDPRVDLDRVMDRFTKALDTEMEIKRVHLELLIRIKNILTPSQQEELLRLREISEDETQ
ncbi:MAG: Spy/CpxP family protein refolding chaperone [Gemmatimonadota bacterium]|jgi:Spy/CpxP family protein refolding chaperone